MLPRAFGRCGERTRQCKFRDHYSFLSCSFSDEFVFSFTFPCAKFFTNVCLRCPMLSPLAHFLVCFRLADGICFATISLRLYAFLISRRLQTQSTFFCASCSPSSVSPIPCAYLSVLCTPCSSYTFMRLPTAPGLRMLYTCASFPCLFLSAVLLADTRALCSVLRCFTASI